VGTRWVGIARAWLVGGAVALLGACGTAPVEHAQPLERASVHAAPTAEQLRLPRRTLVGAHYYHWYPGNWAQGTLRAQLDPPQQPELGHYDSAEPAVAEQHIEWASAHGIDFFTLDWWPVRHQENQVGITGFLEARNIDDISFSIFYETWDLSFDPDRGYADMDAPGVRQAFVEDMAQLADTYFSHPSYLRVDGRPVVILYLTRVLVGDVAGAMADVRAMWRARGHDPFVVADEVFWKVTADLRPAAFTTRPQASRIRLFDAVTAYNPYESSNTSHAGYGDQSRFVADVNGLYQRYRDATGGEVPFVPGVLPGYNDRGVRPRQRHYVIPRAWGRGGEEGTFLAEMLRQVADRWVDPRAPMVMVTSWNEWNEDTGIEPLRSAPATASDVATDGISRTDGAPYAGLGTRYLEVLRDHYVAIAGSVLDAEGRPVVGTLVSAWRGGKVVARRTTDHAGRYTLPRAPVGDAPVHIVALGLEQRVVPDPARTVFASFG
jgi:glycoprotein endo-alpha-1,2-mannosidase